MKLGKKISWVMVMIITVFGLLTVLIINYVIADALRESVQDKEVSLAKVVASNLANPALSGNYLTVQRTLEGLSEDRQLVYAYLILPDGNVLHTLKKTISNELVELNRLTPGEPYSLESFMSNEGRVQDVGVFLIEGLESELHIGFKEDYIQATLERVFGTIVLITLLGVTLGSLAAGALGKYLSSPIEKLTKITRKITYGELDHRVDITSKDEVGELAQSFNRMLVVLDDSMSKLKLSEEEQRIKNRELSALNRVAETVRLERDVNVVLRDALIQVIENLDLNAGWINLRLGEGKESRSIIGVRIDEREIPCQECKFCDCDLLNIEKGQCLSKESLEINNKSFQVTGVPIYVNDRVLGAMHLLSDQELIPADLATLQTIGGQLGTVIENVNLWRELKVREERVRQLLEKVIVAQEDERKRIARELHDETSQSLAALAMRLKVSMGWIHKDTRKAEALLEESKDEAVRIMRELHNIVFHLRPTLLDDLGLIPALRWLAESRDWKEPLEVDVQGNWSKERIDPQVETTLYRIGQEAITNAAKYSQATHLFIEFKVEETKAILKIQDNGKGFIWDENMFELEQGKKPLGLVGMMERASLIGGRVEIHSDVKHGTTVEAVIPLKREDNHYGKN
ncbi:Sensor histidine kinase [Desulfosporosinus sp. I2]|uniref:histidine kinase n=1 Tax=Desulfosporosinus sp. I2 TaxID=1617025 RepID=UPI00061FBA37|nr:histidine kinase [Desulfosporosinus sp. I2]KJR46407.1 Sensor histidine kinase [Desulfosporosinus sp. I2]